MIKEIFNIHKVAMRNYWKPVLGGFAAAFLLRMLLAYPMAILTMSYTKSVFPLGVSAMPAWRMVIYQVCFFILSALPLVVGPLVAVWLMKREQPLSSSPLARGEGNTNPNAEEMERKRENLEKVMALAAAKGEIANDDVEHGLGVSDKTAERYLEELVEQGKIDRVGSPGKYVIYKRV